jgi:hypothetical protein
MLKMFEEVPLTENCSSFQITLELTQGILHIAVTQIVEKVGGI